MRKHRSWIALAIYIAAFALWPLDRRDVAGFLTRLFPATGLGNGLGYAIATVVVGIGAASITWSVSRASREVPAVPMVICWIGFGLLLNWMGLAIVAVGMTSLAVRFGRGGPGYGLSESPDWKRGILQSAHVWIAAAALIALALTLREPVFFGFLAGALAMRILAGWYVDDVQYDSPASGLSKQSPIH